MKLVEKQPRQSFTLDELRSKVAASYAYGVKVAPWWLRIAWVFGSRYKRGAKK